MSLDTTNRIEVDEVRGYNVLKRVTKSKYTEIITCGRGGLSVAQRLAYHLDIPVMVWKKAFLSDLKPNQLFVDDIVCSGATIGLLPRNVDTAVLVQRKSALYKATYSGITVTSDNYVTFSWEK